MTPGNPEYSLHVCYELTTNTKHCRSSLHGPTLEFHNMFHRNFLHSPTTAVELAITHTHNSYPLGGAQSMGGGAGYKFQEVNFSAK